MLTSHSEISLLNFDLARCKTETEKINALKAEKDSLGKSDEGKSDEEMKKYVDLRNMKIESREDLVKLCQTFRNPKYETFRIIYMNKNKTQKLASDNELYLLTRLDKLGFDKIIHQSRNIVNPYSMQKLENNSAERKEDLEYESAKCLIRPFIGFAQSFFIVKNDANHYR